MTLIFDFNFLAFFGHGKCELFHCRLCRMVSGSYSNTHFLSPVMTFHSKFGSIFRRLRMLVQTTMRHAFWLKVNNFGTTFAQIFVMPKSSVIIFQTQSRLIFSSSAIIRIVSRRSPHITCLIHSTFASALPVDGLPLFASSSRSSQPFLNRLCYLKTRERDMTSSS